MSQALGVLADADLMAFVSATDLDRARTFYGATLGLRETHADPFAAVFDAGGTTLRITLVDALAGAPYTVLGWIVTDIAETITGLVTRGVEFRRIDGMEQDALGVWTAPGGDKVAWFADPDGNLLSLTELVRP